MRLSVVLLVSVFFVSCNNNIDEEEMETPPPSTQELLDRANALNRAIESIAQAQKEVEKASAQELLDTAVSNVFAAQEEALSALGEFDKKGVPEKDPLAAARLAGVSSLMVGVCQITEKISSASSDEEKVALAGELNNIALRSREKVRSARFLLSDPRPRNAVGIKLRDPKCQGEKTPPGKFCFGGSSFPVCPNFTFHGCWERFPDGEMSYHAPIFTDWPYVTD